MKVTRFDPRGELIFVDGKLWSPRGEVQRQVRLVLDTGAAETIVVPEVLDELGYSPRDGEQITVMRSAVGREQGYLTRVARFSSLGHREDNYRVHVHDLPEGWGIDGLIGLTFLRRFNYEIRSSEGRIVVDRIAA
jgi:predicted aspartyl protease